MSAPAAKNRTALVVILIVSGFLLVCGGGVAFGVAAPAFRSYTRRALSAEASANVRAMVTGAVAYAEEHGTFPPAVPRTPALPSTEPRAWPADASPGWDALGFRPSDPIRYSYEFAILPNGECAARAYGDPTATEESSSRSRAARTASRRARRGSTSGEPSRGGLRPA
jgi:hypothetical protein